MKGYVQVYTGNGKGKTTAAFRLAFRAAGAGLNVRIIQFLKSGDYSEIKAAARFSEHICVEQYGAGRFVRGKPTKQERAQARKGYEVLYRCVQEGEYDLVIAEELNVALYYHLVTLEEVKTLIQSKADTLELVITGRNAHPDIIDMADLVTEMKEIKHYYKAGVKARRGIEK